MAKRVLFIDRDGTLIKEPENYQVDSIEKVEFYPQVFQYLSKIQAEGEFELVVVSNQDGLGTDAFPEEDFWSAQLFVRKAFENENIHFAAEFFDRSYAKDKLSTRKPQTGMLRAYLNNLDYDLSRSYVIGDRLTDMELAKNLGAKGIWLCNEPDLATNELSVDMTELQNVIVLKTQSWADIYTTLRLGARVAVINRQTLETQIKVRLDLDGSGQSSIHTGLGFYDHMLEQIAKHGGFDLDIDVKGDLHIDEHHTVEDTALALGMAFRQALGSKVGLERYGFCLPMDDALARVALDFGGRPWLVWKAKFKREKIGSLPCELFEHFFKSFADSALANLNIKAKGKNEHHKIESIFKAFARSLKMACKRSAESNYLPSTKGVL